MGLENNQLLSEFIHNDRFDLNSHLTYLIDQLKDVSKQGEDKINQWIATK